MKLDKEFFKKYSLVICAVVSLISLFLPVLTAEVDSEFVSDTQSFTLISGISEGGWIGIALIVCPAVVIAMHFIKQLENYKPLISVIAPAICIVGLIIDYFLLKSGISGFDSAMSSMNSMFDTSADISAEMKIGVGFFLAMASYVAMLVLGAMTYHGLKLSKEGIKEFADNTISNIDSEKLNDLKDSSIQKLSQLKDTAASKVSSAVETVKETASNISGNISETASDTVSPESQPVSKKKVNKDIDNTLSLIEKLADMKEKGILTEEEFTEKKKELLENI